MKNRLRRLASLRVVTAIMAVLVIGGIGSYLYASSHALAPTPLKSEPVLLQPYSLGTAPYQYIAYSGSLDASLAATAVKQYFAAFVLSSPIACTPAWGGSADNNLYSPRAAAIGSDITALRSHGGDVTVSFGGESGSELATTCNSVSDLTAAYNQVIAKYNLHQVDFDIEGASLMDGQANVRRADAIVALQRAHPGLKVWITLPVSAKGLTDSGVVVMRQLKNAGVVVSGVNIMAMNYNVGPVDMAEQAIAAAQTSHSQLKQLYPTATDANIWKALGVTVMAGVNNTVPEIFTLADAPKVQAFAISKGIGMVGIWNVGRDMACADNPDGTPADQMVAMVACSGVAQQPYDFLKALAIPAS